MFRKPSSTSGSDSGAVRFLKARALALKRRLSLRFRGEFDPYPATPAGMSFNPSEWTQGRGAAMRRKLDLSQVKPGGIEAWQHEARQKFRELLRLPDTAGGPEVLDRMTMPVAPGYVRTRVYLRFAPGRDAPVDIVRHADRPDGESAGVVICMQGTNAGAHLNLGEVRMPADVYKVASGSALALQAADNGFTAVSFERACFGERRERRLDKMSDSPTIDASVHALNLGETLLGQTVSELEALQSWIGRELAPGAPVYLAGYSAAGTAAIAAAAASDVFDAIAVGGCVGWMTETLLERAASGYNDIPDVLAWFEFDAIMALVAPRPCLVIAGERDHIWPWSGASEVMASAERAWAEQGQPEAMQLLRAPGIHTYYPELMWPAFVQLAGARS